MAEAHRLRRQVSEIRAGNWKYCMKPIVQTPARPSQLMEQNPTLPGQCSLNAVKPRSSGGVHLNPGHS